MASVRVIACGSEDLGDDAAGLLAVRDARSMLEVLPGVEVIEAGLGLRILDLLDGVDAALVVDAVRSPGGERHPGELVRIEAGPDGLTADIGSSLSSHGFGVGEAVGLAAALGRIPRVVFLGVEAAGAEAGQPLSAAVSAAFPDLVRGIVAEAKSLMDTLGS